MVFNPVTWLSTVSLIHHRQNKLLQAARARVMALSRVLHLWVPRFLQLFSAFMGSGYDYILYSSAYHPTSHYVEGQLTLSAYSYHPFFLPAQ